jgi:nucleotide-binding universal stress UspA family protein
MHEAPGVPTIVVGVEGSAGSADALRWAVSHAERTGAVVEAVSAWHVPPTIYITPTWTEADYERRAQEGLDRVVEEVVGDRTDVQVDKRLILQAPSVALTHAAEGADLLVVGGKGVGELPGVHLGSVASFCVHHAPCHVVVVRGTTAPQS